MRIDGRGPRDLRPLSSEVGVLPTAHGTGLFQRGETQVMNVVTMAMPRMNQLIDTLSPETHKYFLFHYNMAPWANGETGRVGSPKRREIGHGALAARALLPVLPSQEEFGYTLRLVAEVLASNGSTSMASVCSGSLALMDAGVPIKAAVAGIAMGLVYAEGKYTTLTDILGAEDAFGDMDFKVAGTADAITALQLDTKIDGIPADVLAAALDQAKEARTEILDNMNACIAEPRAEVAATAPKIITIPIPMDKIGEVIGPKGKVINTIQQETGADIAVDDDGSAASSPSAPSRPGGWRRPRPASSRSSIRRRPTSARSTWAGSSTSPSSVRSSTSSPAATAWCTSPSSAAASGSTPSRTCSRSARRSRSSSRRSTRRARSA